MRDPTNIRKNDHWQTGRNGDTRNLLTQRPIMHTSDKEYETRESFRERQREAFSERRFIRDSTRTQLCCRGPPGSGPGVGRAPFAKSNLVLAAILIAYVCRKIVL